MTRLKGMLAIPALIAAAACAPPPASGLDASGDEYFQGQNACWIEFIETASGGLVLEAWAAPGLTGSYELAVSHASADGDAFIEQSGPFTSARDTPERIHEITLGGNAPRRGASLGEMMASMRDAQPGTTVISSGGAGDSRYDVSLRLLDPDGRQICVAEHTGP